MEKHIATYLFQHKNCPLPGIGSLELLDGSAYISVGDKKAIAPVPTIYLSETGTKILPEEFELYIAEIENIPTWEAKNRLTHFCRQISELPVHGELPLASIGVFYKDPGNKTGFRNFPLPKTFAPDVKAEKIIHPNESHDMVVGDKLTTTAAMSEFYSEKTMATRNKWWIAPAIIALLSLLFILIYFNSRRHNTNSGNAQPVQSNNLTESYQLK